MKHYRFNQIAMAVLGALLLIFGTRTIIKIASEEPEAEKPGLEVAGTKPEEKAPAGAAQEGDHILALLATADPAKGAEVAKKCQLCHNFEKGGPNLIGPNLFGVLGRDIGSHEGYDYSEELKSFPGNWDYLKIDGMITNPAVFAPGTKMALFPGLPDAKQRAEVLAFLRTKNDNPPALPEAGAAGAAPAGGEAPAGKTAEAPAAAPEAAKPAAPAGGGSEVVVLLATADPKAGESDAALCKVCHTFDKGGPVLVGPNLYGVVGRKIAAVEGFNYTPALKAHQGDGEWTYELIDTWITNPQVFAPGTMMAFPGIADPKKRADVIAFLRSKNDNPPPLPSAGAAAPAAAPAAPKAEEAAPPPGAPAAPKAEAPVETPAAPTAETPPPPAETPAAPSAETPAAPATEAPTPAPEVPAPAETTPPSAETPAAPPAEAPAAEAPAPAETPAAEAPAPPETPAAPSAETPAEAPAAETPASNPSVESQPQPVYPDGPPQ
jgi:cytochrome c